MINSREEFIRLDDDQAEQFLSSGNCMQDSYEIITDSIIGTDDKLHITVWNKASEKLFGWTSGEVLGQRIIDIIPTEISEIERSKLVGLMNNGQELSHETSHFSSSGRRIIIESKITAIRNRFNRVIGYVSINRDITQQKEREKKLQLEKLKAEFLLELSEKVVEVIDDYDSVVKEISKGIANLIGETCLIKLVSDCGNILNPASCYSRSKETMEIFNNQSVSFQLLVNGKFLDSVIKTGKSIFLPVVDCSEYPLSNMNRLSHCFCNVFISSYIAVPLKARGRIIGVICLLKHSSDEFYSKEDLSFIEAIAGKISLVISNARLYNEKLNEIEERKKAEKKLAENESLLSQILEVLPVGVWLSDAKGELIRGNEKAFEIWKGENSPESEILKKYNSFWSGIENINGNGDKPSAGKTAQTKVKTDYVDIILSDGTIKRISNSTVPVFNTNNEIIGAVVVNQDITEIKQFETELKKSEERFHMLADNISQFAWIADENGNRIWFNKRWYEYTGTTPKEMVGSGWQTVHHPEHLFKIIEGLQKSFITGQPWEDTVKLRGKNGEYRWFLGRALPLHDKNGKIIQWFGTNTDITEKEESRRKLESTLSELERSNRELQQFAYVASHDLQEPLRMVTNYLKLLEYKYKHRIDSRASEYIEFAVDGSKRMAELIKALLSFSRISAHTRNFESVDMNEIYGMVINDLQFSIKESGAKMTVSALPHVKADATQMRQLLQNLVGNAVKFHGQKNPEVKIKAEKRKNEWLFSVKDNGIGINPEYFDRIFLIFQRLNNREKYAGTGIGLAICRKIVECHGGKIWIESEEAKGSTFFFTIPRGE